MRINVQHDDESNRLIIDIQCSNAEEVNELLLRFNSMLNEMAKAHDTSILDVSSKDEDLIPGLEAIKLSDINPYIHQAMESFNEILKNDLKPEDLDLFFKE